MRRLHAPVAVVMVAGLLAVAPAIAEQERPSQKAVKAWRAALKQGRALASKKQWKQAAAKFRAALKAIPDEPAASSELGWALFQLGDLDGAEAASQPAVRPGAPARVRAATHYNLGRIAEQRGDKAAAVEQYARSLELRDNPVVRKRLGDLDPARAAALDPFAPRAADGPFVSLEAYCKGRNEHESCRLGGAEDDDEHDSGVRGAAALARPAAPWKSARLFSNANGDCLLAMQTPKGWFVTSPGMCDDAEFLNTDVDAMEAVELFAGAEGAELRLEVTSTYGYRDYDEEEGHSFWAEYQERWLVICAVGASGVPACTPALDSFVGDDGVRREASRKLSIDGDAIVLGAPEGKPSREWKDQVGRHPIVFP